MADFTLERKDLSLLQNHLARNLRALSGYRFLRLAVAVLGGVFAGLGASALSKAYDCCDRTQPYIEQFLWLSAASIAVFVGLAVWNKVRMGRVALSKDGWFLAPQSVLVSEEGIDHSTTLGTSRMQWSGIQQRQEDDRNIYLLVEPSLGIIIPQAALSPQELALIRGKVRSAA
jgi:hypothetical protein